MIINYYYVNDPWTVELPCIEILDDKMLTILKETSDTNYSFFQEGRGRITVPWVTRT